MIVAAERDVHAHHRRHIHADERHRGEQLRLRTVILDALEHVQQLVGDVPQLGLRKRVAINELALRRNPFTLRQRIADRRFGDSKRIADRRIGDSKPKPPLLIGARHSEC